METRITCVPPAQIPAGGPVFRQFVLLRRDLGLFGEELIAVDGTRIKAVSNKDRNFTRASLAEFIRLADAKLGDYLKWLETNVLAEANTVGSRVENLAEKIAAVRGRRDRCKAMFAELDRTGESQMSLTDPDSWAMAGHTHVAVGYNAGRNALPCISPPVCCVQYAAPESQISAIPSCTP